MKMSDGGKGDSPRKQQDQKAYEEGWERVFKRERTKEKLSKEEPLKDDEND